MTEYGVNENKVLEKTLNYLFDSEFEDYVKVGILADPDNDVKEAEDYHDTSEGSTSYTTILDVALANEFGTKNIPERSFLRSSFIKYNRKFQRIFIAMIRKDMADGKLDMDMLLKKAGAYWVGLVKKQITDIRKPPNAPSTIKKKGSSNPLIDTGQLRASIGYEVIRKERGDDS